LHPTYIKYSYLNKVNNSCAKSEPRIVLKKGDLCMTNKHIKDAWSVSTMQITTTMKYHHVIRTAIIKNQIILSFKVNAKKLIVTHHCREC
jgi:hypothetical protein